MRVHVKPKDQPIQEMTLEDVNARLISGDLDGDELGWSAGLTDWTSLRNIEGVDIPTPPPLPGEVIDPKEQTVHEYRKYSPIQFQPTEIVQNTGKNKTMDEGDDNENIHDNEKTHCSLTRCPICHKDVIPVVNASGTIRHCPMCGYYGNNFTPVRKTYVPTNVINPVENGNLDELNSKPYEMMVDVHSCGDEKRCEKDREGESLAAVQHLDRKFLDLSYKVWYMVVCLFSIILLFFLPGEAIREGIRILFLPLNRFTGGINPIRDIIIVGVILIFYAINYNYAKRKNKSAYVWGVVGSFIFPLFTLIVLSFASYLCPFCHKELEKKDYKSKKCPFCKRPFISMNASN